MPNPFTRCDSIREYLTGAASDGASQSNPLLSLGGFRSSSEAVSYGLTIFNPISNIVISYASGSNAPGNGQLTCIDSDTLSWQDASGSGPGPAQSLLNGQTIILETPNPSAYVRITRTSDVDLASGVATISLAPLIDNVFSMEDITSSNAASGITTVRAAIIRNESTNPVSGFSRYIGQLGSPAISNAGILRSSGSGSIATNGNFKDWPLSGYCQIQQFSGSIREVVYYTSRTNTLLVVPAAGRGLLGTSASQGQSFDILFSVPGIAVGIDPFGITNFGGFMELVDNDTILPSGVTWNLGLTSSTGLNIGTLNVGQQVGIWIMRQIPAGCVATPNVSNLVMDSFNAF